MIAKTQKNSKFRDSRMSVQQWSYCFLVDTVDCWNPAPVDMVNIPLFIGFPYIPGGCLGFLPSDTINLFSSRAYKSERKGRTIRWHSQPILDRLDPNSLELVRVELATHFETLSPTNKTVDGWYLKVRFVAEKNRSKSIVGRLASFLKVGFFFTKYAENPTGGSNETSRETGSILEYKISFPLNSLWMHTHPNNWAWDWGCNQYICIHLCSMSKCCRRCTYACKMHL